MVVFSVEETAAFGAEADEGLSFCAEHVWERELELRERVIARYKEMLKARLEEGKTKKKKRKRTLRTEEEFVDAEEGSPPVVGALVEGSPSTRRW